MDLEERFRILGEKKFRFSAIAFLGLLEQEEGDLAESQAYLEQALANSRECGWKNTIVWHLAALSVTFYLQGNVVRFKQIVRESISLAKGLSKVTKFWLLVVVLNALSLPKPDRSACILGSVDTLRRENGLSIGTPLLKYYYDRSEGAVRKALGNTTFELAFAEGQKIPVNAALDLVLKTVEEM